MIKDFVKLTVLACVLASFPAMAVIINVNSVPGMVDTNLTFAAGTTLTIVATGQVDLANNSGGYFVGPDGVLITGPTNLSGAFNWFKANAEVAGVDPITGVTKTPSAILAPAQIPNMVGAPYGALIAGFTTNPTPTLFSDFIFVLVGANSTFSVPGVGSYDLWLGVNDTHPSNSPTFGRSDNTGVYAADVTAIPEPAAFALLGTGLLAFSLVRRRRQV